MFIQYKLVQFEGGCAGSLRRTFLGGAVPAACAGTNGRVLQLEVKPQQIRLRRWVRQPFLRSI